MTTNTVVEKKTRGEMANESKICSETLVAWFESAGIPLEKRKRIVPKYQKMFYEKYGYPKGINKSDYDYIEL
jgi:hypothetical protein